MKFKANLTLNGLHLLEKRILPALDKMGKNCHIYFTPHHIFFLHNLLNSHGIQSIAQFRVESLFSNYKISSQNDNQIAFSLDLPLLHRALRSLITIGVDLQNNNNNEINHNNVVENNNDTIQIKLVKKQPPFGQLPPMPYLTFEAKGYKSAVIQDVPISKPLSRAEVSELKTALANAQDMPPVLVQVGDMNQMQSFVDRMKHVGDVIDVSISKYGDLWLKMETTLITLGAEFRKLVVVGERAEMPVGEENLTAQTRTTRAVQRGDAMTVQVGVKHFFKSLQCHLAKPDCAFYGIGPMGSCLTVIFQFFVPGTRQTDKSISLHCRIPVLDTGSS